MTMTSLFDTFVPTQEFGELVGSNGVGSIESGPWMNDSLFGFMNTVEEFQVGEDDGWNGTNSVMTG